MVKYLESLKNLKEKFCKESPNVDVKIRNLIKDIRPELNEVIITELIMEIDTLIYSKE